jgi:thymidylate synthase ThyX
MTVGKEGISAKIIRDSITVNGVRLTTFELEYPRFILAEVNTHRMLSKNSASSRAIPVKKMLDMILNNPATPVYWGKNQPGMSAKEEVMDLMEVQQMWKNASVSMVHVAEYLDKLGLHKQITNRITEPWQRMKTVITGTEWANLKWLRNHSDAQPEFEELAKCIDTEFANSVPNILRPGDWHLPYVHSPKPREYTSNGEPISLEDALKLSSSCCAQVSYRNLNDSLEKAIDIYDKLVGSTHKHASPFEHQGTPIALHTTSNVVQWEKGVTHMDRSSQLWSGNLRGWVQHRQLIPGHAVW